MLRTRFLFGLLALLCFALTSEVHAQNDKQQQYGNQDPQPVFKPSSTLGDPAKIKGDPSQLNKRFGSGFGKGKDKDKENDDGFDTLLGQDQGFIVGHPDIKYVEDNDHANEEIDFYHSPYHQFLYPEKGVYKQDGNYEDATVDPNHIENLKGVDETYDPAKEPYKTFIYHDHPPYPIPEFPFGGLHTQYQEFIKKNRYKPYYGYKGHLGLKPKEAEHFGKFVDGLFTVGAAFLAMGGAALFFPFTWGPGIFGRTTERAFSSMSSYVSNQFGSLLPMVKGVVLEEECMDRLACELEARGYVNSANFFRFIEKMTSAEDPVAGGKRAGANMRSRKGENSSGNCNRNKCHLLNAFFAHQPGGNAKKETRFS